MREGEPAALRRLRELQVESDGVPNPQPDWLRFLFALGTTVGRGPEHMRGAVVLPVSRVGAAAVCVGVVVARAAAEWGLSPDIEEHVRRLQELPIGASVTLIRGKRLLRGLFRGVRTMDDGRILIGVQVESNKAGRLTHWVDVREAAGIQPTADLRRLPDSQKGEPVRQGSPLLDHVFGPAAESFARSVRTDVICIGNRRALAEDLAGVTLRWRTNARAKGTLVDLARVADLGVTSRASRARWQAASSRSDHAEADANAVVIFTDAHAFLRGRDGWGSASWIALLDRSEGSFEEAAETTKQIYLDGGYEAVRWDGSIPHGIELLLWKAA